MKGLNIVSGDVVEVAPAYDHAGKMSKTNKIPGMKYEVLRKQRRIMQNWGKRYRLT